jgi:uncharacterized membrane protein YfcA
MPIYAITDGDRLWAIAPLIVLATAGVVTGTLAGHRVLAAVPQPLFRRVVAVLLFALGVVVIAGAA